MTAPDESAASIPADRAELEKDIEQTRNQLAETVEALAYKADVKARLKDRTTELTDQAKQRGAQLTDQAKQRGTRVAGSAREAAQQPAGQAAGVAGIVGLVVLIVWLFRRRS